MYVLLNIYFYNILLSILQRTCYQTVTTRLLELCIPLFVRLSVYVYVLLRFCLHLSTRQTTGRIEEEIKMLLSKVKHIDECIAFCGKRTRTAISQGRKVQITLNKRQQGEINRLFFFFVLV